jgi:hypothetical protein
MLCWFILMHNRMCLIDVHAELIEETIERSRRVYKRCGKLVLTSAGTPLLCSICASDSSKDYCIVCDKDCTAQKYQGQICKTCAPRKVLQISRIDS